MEIKILNYVLRPDNGSTWSLTKLQKVTKGKNDGNIEETSAIYPKDLKHCILRIREDLRREDKSYIQNLEEFTKSLDSIDNTLMAFIEKAIIDFKDSK